MHRRRAIRSGILAAALLLAPPAGAQAPAGSGAAEAPAGDVENGKRIYQSYGCYQCHGYQGQGTMPTGPRVGPPALTLKAFTDYMRQPTGQMPPYTARVLSDAEAADIYAFLRTQPKPPEARSIPLLAE